MQYLVLDCNYLCHKSRFDTGQMWHDGDDVNVVFGFLEKVINLCESFRTNNLLFIWDSKKSYRKEQFPKYKQKRHTDLSEEERRELKSAFRQMEILQYEVLPELGFKNVYHQDGIEGDDIMAQVVFQDESAKHEYLMIASDHDLYQLLAYNTTMFVSRGEMFVPYTLKNFKAEFGITPKEWVLVKAIGGCKSDEIPGVGRDAKDPSNIIARIGEKTVCSYLRGELKDTTKAFKRIESKEGRAIRKFNIPLVKLPHAKTDGVEIVENEFQFRGFKKVCKRFGFRTFLRERKDEWKRAFKGYENEKTV